MTSCAALDQGAFALHLAIGEDATFTFSVPGLPDLAGYKLYFVVKVRLEDAIPVFLKRSLNAGGADAQALIMTQSTSRGKYQVFLSFADSRGKLPSIEAPYSYATWVVDPSGKHLPVIARGDFSLDPTPMTFTS